jgi:hypothetical protein
MRELKRTKQNIKEELNEEMETSEERIKHKSWK